MAIIFLTRQYFLTAFKDPLGPQKQTAKSGY